jgi:hypothetical protein
VEKEKQLDEVDIGLEKGEIQQLENAFAGTMTA